MDPEPAGQLSVTDRIDEATQAAVRLLVRDATAHDGVAPLGEAVLLALTGRSVQHLTMHRAGRLVGYAQLDLRGPAAELVVAPEHRHHGLGRTLLDALVQHTAGHRLRVWAHGDLPGARALAQGLGFVRERGLLQLRRELDEPLPVVTMPPGIRLRAFVPGRDDDELLALNARAFVDLPDQGGLSLADLHARMAQPWFDPAGLLVATDAEDTMVAFHWTKVHEHVHPAPSPAGAVDPGPDVPRVVERIGEVYVVGVDPSQQGHGLGRAITLAGLHHLQGTGLDTVMLYVDDSNLTALRLYSSLGFHSWHVDVEYGRP